MTKKRVKVGHFVIPLKPMPYGRARVCARGIKPRFFINPKEIAWRKNLIEGVRASWGNRNPLDCPLAVAMKFTFQRPQKSRWWAPAGRPDVDNLAKGVHDSLNKIVWLDDARIVDLVVSKQWGEVPSVEIEVYKYVES